MGEIINLLRVIRMTRNDGVRKPNSIFSSLAKTWDSIMLSTFQHLFRFGPMVFSGKHSTVEKSNSIRINVKIF